MRDPQAFLAGLSQQRSARVPAPDLQGLLLLAIAVSVALLLDLVVFFFMASH
jgi:hypothetical protein